MNSARIFVTGGTGFIGSHVINRFVQAGAPLTCLVRPGSDCSAIPQGDVRLVQGDVADFQSLRNAMAGHGSVIHTAAYVSDWGPPARFHEVNVQGTLNVLTAAQASGINDLVITGSIAVYGEAHSPVIKDETSPFRSHYHYFLDKPFPCRFNEYRDSKALAIRKAGAYATSNGLNLTILEPVWVYGEREKNTGFYEYIRAVKQGMFAAPGARRNKFHVVYAGDLAHAYYLAHQKQCAGVNRFIIGNPKAEKMDEIWAHFCREAGLKKPWRLPKWSVYPLGFLLELIYTAAHSKKPPILTRGRVNMFYDSIEYSTDKARAVLGFTCSHSLEAGIKKTVRWYKEKGWL